jgi:hypothetical protein
MAINKVEETPLRKFSSKIRLKFLHSGISKKGVYRMISSLGISLQSKAVQLVMWYRQLQQNSVCMQAT